MRPSCEGHRTSGIVGAVIVLLTMCQGCASAMDGKMLGQPCTRSDQCAKELICSGGSCVPESSDGGQPDASTFDDDAGPKQPVGK